ncbi:MAG: hypothetical protein SFW07_01760 [Gammaproteobacteria bacterium]|nr:hypothetical protein [Gammaproteobacteria bacterium]
MTKATTEDDTNLVEEVSEEAVLEAEEITPVDTEESIPEDEEGRPIRKKVAALKARHRLEDYFEMKRIQDELDYLDDEKKRKAELLQKVAQIEKHYEKPEKPVKEPKPTKQVVVEVPAPETVVKSAKEAHPAKSAKKAPIVKPKRKAVKPKPKAKPKAKPKSKKKAKK